MNELSYQRRIEDVTRDIRVKTGQFLMDAIEIGRLLMEAKAMVEPGKWGEYVQTELPFSHSWANNYMRLYKELGAEQISMFGNSQAIMKLSPTKALELLVLPEEQREDFVQSHDVEAMSSRELHQAIRELEEEKSAREKAEKIMHLMKEKLSEAVEAKETVASQSQEMHHKLLVVASERDKIAEDLKKAKRSLAEAEQKEREAGEALRKAKEQPQIPESMIEQMRKEAEAAAAAKVRKDLQKQTEGLEEKLLTAQTAARDAEERLACAQREVKRSNPNVVIFKTIMEQIQGDFNRLNGVLLKVEQEEPEIAGNLRRAFVTLLDKLREVI